MKHSEQKRRFKSRRSFFVLGAIALLPIIFGCQKALSAKNHPSPPVPPAPGPATEPLPVEVPFTTPIKKYIKAFPTSFVSPDGRWVVGQSDAGEQASLSTIDGKTTKNVPIYDHQLFVYGTVSPWSADSKKLLTLSLKNDAIEEDFLVYQFKDQVSQPIKLKIPGAVVNGPPPVFSPNGQSIAAGVQLTAGDVNAKPEVSFLTSVVVWTMNKSQVYSSRVFSFSSNVSHVVWLDNQHLFVFTVGRHLSKVYILDYVSRRSHLIKELSDKDVWNILPYGDKKRKGYITIVTDNEGKEHLEILNSQMRKSTRQVPLDPPYNRRAFFPFSVNVWQFIGNAQHIYVFRRTHYDWGIDIRHYNPDSKTLGRIYHLDITAFPSIDNLGQVGGVQKGTLVNFGKLE